MKGFAVLFVGLVLFLLFTEGRAHARDLPKSDPERLAILNAARGTRNIKFVVKDLFKSGDFAFLCALEQHPKYGILATDDMPDVDLFVFIKHEGVWIAVDTGGNLAKDTRHVPCTIPRNVGESEDKAITSQEDIIRVLSDVARGTMLPSHRFRVFREADMALPRLLLQRHLISDVSIEEEKETLDSAQLKISQERCGTPACVDDTRKTFALMRELRTDAKISSLVWNGCIHGVRPGNLAEIRECVAQMSLRSYCRPNMNLLGDRDDINKCIDETSQLCRPWANAGAADAPRPWPGSR